MLPQNKTLFGLDQLAKFSILHGKENTFVANGGYHYNEEVKWNLFELRAVVKTSQRMAIRRCELWPSPSTYTRRHQRVLAATKLIIGWSTCSEMEEAACVAAWGCAVDDQSKGHGYISRERKWERERERERGELKRQINDDFIGGLAGKNGGDWGKRASVGKGGREGVKERWGRACSDWATWQQVNGPFE